MASTQDYYEILGVSKAVSDQEIKKAYRSLARKYHPDVYKEADAQERFKQINEAYQVLSDPRKRSAYDQFGKEAFSPGFGSTGGWPGGASVDFNFDFSNFRDPFEIFEEFFGTRSPFGFGFGAEGRRSNRYTGEDLHFELTISFKEAVFGTERDVSLERLVNCSECAGSGVARGSKKVTCDKCRGRGVIQRSTRSIFGNILTNTTCDKCGGSGQVPEKACPQCKGKTVVTAEEKRSLKIPAGVDDGTNIRYPGLGNAGPNGGGYGDLYLTVRVLEEKTFKRDGLNIYTDLPISFGQAALGDEVVLETLEGNERVKINPGTQPGEQIRLRGRGVPSVGSRARGDLIAVVKIEVPTHLSSKQKELLKEFERS